MLPSAPFWLPRWPAGLCPALRGIRRKPRSRVERRHHGDLPALGCPRDPRSLASRPGCGRWLFALEAQREEGKMIIQRITIFLMRGIRRRPRSHAECHHHGDPPASVCPRDPRSSTSRPGCGRWSFALEAQREEGKRIIQMITIFLMQGIRWRPRSRAERRQHGDPPTSGCPRDPRSSAPHHSKYNYCFK